MTKFTIIFDTICSGFTPIMDGAGKPLSYDTEEAAQAEIEDDHNGMKQYLTMGKHIFFQNKEDAELVRALRYIY